MKKFACASMKMPIFHADQKNHTSVWRKSVSSENTSSMYHAVYFLIA